MGEIARACQDGGQVRCPAQRCGLPMFHTSHTAVRALVPCSGGPGRHPGGAGAARGVRASIGTLRVVDSMHSRKVRSPRAVAPVPPATPGLLGACAANERLSAAEHSGLVRGSSQGGRRAGRR